jgi:hypothetical protein
MSDLKLSLSSRRRLLAAAAYFAHDHCVSYTLCFNAVQATAGAISLAASSILKTTYHPSSFLSALRVFGQLNDLIRARISASFIVVATSVLAGASVVLSAAFFRLSTLEAAYSFRHRGNCGHKVATLPVCKSSYRYFYIQ